MSEAIILDPATAGLLDAIAQREGRTPDNMAAHLVRLYARHADYMAGMPGGLFADASAMPPAPFEHQDPRPVPVHDGPSIQQATDMFMSAVERGQRSDSTIANHRKAILASGIDPQTPLSAIDRSIARSALSGMTKGRKASTVNLFLSCLSTVARFATDEGLINRNPWAGLKIKVTEDVQDRRLPFTDAQLSRVVKSKAFKRASRERQAAFLACLYLGCRSGEWLGVQPSDIVTLDGVKAIRFHSNKFRTLKTAASERMVPLPQAGGVA